MRLVSIKVSDYRRLHSATIEFAPVTQGALLSDLYDNLNVTLLVGPNGSGKTSLLSFIAQLFHNLQRFPERVPGAFELTYDLLTPESEAVRCTLYRTPGATEISLNVPGRLSGTLLRETAEGIPLKRPANSILYGDARQFIPRNIIVSAFSLHGEYPSPRTGNFIGDRPVAMYDTKNLYGRNHFGFPSFSVGIRRLMSLVIERTEGVSELERLLGGRFTGRVATFKRSETFLDYVLRVEGRRSRASEWKPYSRAIEDSEKRGRLFLNDFEIETPDGVLCLANMSSGQKMLFVRLLSLLSKIEDGSLLLVEEPELHLDPSWTRQLITIFLFFFRKFYAHLLIATHSFSLINAVPSDRILLAHRGVFSAPSRPTLLANESSLAWSLFAAEPHKVEQYLLAKIEHASKAELIAMIEQMGESSIRVDAFRRLRRLESED